MRDALVGRVTQYGPKKLIASIGPYIAGAIVVAVPLVAYATSILYSFYGIGSSFHDAGWSAYLIHEADLQIHDPPCVDDGVSWFNSHISPLFLATSALGHLVPLTRIQFYAAYIGISHALPAVAVFWLLLSGYRMTSPMPCIAAALLALFFSFNGLALAIARFPHFTMFIVGTGMMFLVALVLRRVALALLFLLLCLSTREDAGFHLFALLSILFVLEWGQGVPWREQKPTAVFAALALLYSAGVVVLQHTLSSREYSLLINEYLGSPFFSQVTIPSMTMRLVGWVAYRGYVVIPAICVFVWAIVRRNVYIALGYVACYTLGSSTSDGGEGNGGYVAVLLRVPLHVRESMAPNRDTDPTAQRWRKYIHLRAPMRICPADRSLLRHVPVSAQSHSHRFSDRLCLAAFHCSPGGHGSGVGAPSRSA
jgi:hypothetical protein